MPKNSKFVVASSALFFVPTAISFFTQSLPVTIVFFNTSLFSTLYHYSGEQDYVELDILWATLSILVSMLLLGGIARKYPIWNLRIIIPVILGLAGLIIYLGFGQSDGENTNTYDYQLYHGLWHLLIGLAGISISITPVKLADVDLSYFSLYKDMLRSNKKKVNYDTFTK